MRIFDNLKLVLNLYWVFLSNLLRIGHVTFDVYLGLSYCDVCIVVAFIIIYHLCKWYIPRRKKGVYTIREISVCTFTHTTKRLLFNLFVNIHWYFFVQTDRRMSNLSENEAILYVVSQIAQICWLSAELDQAQHLNTLYSKACLSWRMPISIPLFAGLSGPQFLKYITRRFISAYSVDTRNAMLYYWYRLFSKTSSLDKKNTCCEKYEKSV